MKLCQLPDEPARGLFFPALMLISKQLLRSDEPTGGIRSMGKDKISRSPNPSQRCPSAYLGVYSAVRIFFVAGWKPATRLIQTLGRIMDILPPRG